MNTFRRRRVLVDRKFQLGISFRIIFCLASYLVLFYLMAVFAPFLIVLLAGGSEEAMTAATTRIVVFVEQLLLPLGLTFACLALHCILISHRIAGPVYRLRKTMESAAAGDLSIDVHLRKGDYLNELAESWNDMVAPIRADFVSLREDVGAAIAGIRAGKETGTDGGPDVLERLERVSAILGEYRLEASPPPVADTVLPETAPAAAEAQGKDPALTV